MGTAAERVFHSTAPVHSIVEGNTPELPDSCGHMLDCGLNDNGRTQE